MANPLKAAYAAKASPSAAPAASTAPAPASVGSQAAQPAPVQTTQIPASAGGGRDLSALRAKLAGGNTGVNPPEAVAALTQDHVEPRTVETPDGGATAAPGWVEGKNGNVVRAPTPEDASSAAVAAAPAETLTRGQKAAATRAANKAKASSEPSGAAPAAAAASSETASVAFELRNVSTDDLLAEIYKRVAARFA